jgi:Flp pilus assembly protein TadG
MITPRPPLLRDTRGNAAVEMALMLPFLLVLLLGSIELGRYFLNQHVMVKGLRDAARYAARGDFGDYYDASTGLCRTAPDDDIVDAARNLAMTGRIADNANWRIPYWDDLESVELTVECFTSVTTTEGGSSTSHTMAGIYTGSAGAPVVTVTAEVAYEPLFGEIFGIGGPDLSVRAQEQAAVMGI